MKLHPSTFGYVKPTEAQFELMDQARQAAHIYADILQNLLPDGPDKDAILRHHRTTAMWANVCITRYSDGTPREGANEAGRRTEPESGFGESEPDAIPGHRIDV